ncbi:MAG: four helix bundle protein [Bdellovibrionota bacterium]
MMSYEKLDVYQCSIKLLSIAISLTDEMLRGHGFIADQIKRAAISIPLNIGEGAGKKNKMKCTLGKKCSYYKGYTNPVFL